MEAKVKAMFIENKVYRVRNLLEFWACSRHVPGALHFDTILVWWHKRVIIRQTSIVTKMILFRVRSMVLAVICIVNRFKASLKFLGRKIQPS